MTSSPLSFHSSPAAGFDEPFEMLLACHERVQRMLALLLRLAEHLVAHGADEQARQAARDVMRYFDQAGPAHHEDEERHVFPLLLAQGDAGIAAVVHRLQRDHEAMTVQWQAVRADLAEIEAGRWPLAQAAGVLPRWQAYAALYAGHIEAEEGRAYPAARPLLPAPALRSMGQEMAQRRGVPPPR
ncbi:MAG: hemerythrin domain-containing protein [Betaproteobacteria bacterium]|nr:hemerythrin domain-containing protein [Betaproteobacteria bacterium]